ncbi:GNAT family N-acetyltransferase [Pontiella agarivorans]|uniref:GNAT family N-acetyltransferase n=1 Tax=Pontiella agarivorans TaxID=3038953 RepID=A0ABU5MV37_9BACT|nr:GNAT family N-acetyltransferase [Pontiella agarivorans]MDZ8118053.1 GNAT family N-acetyltransferase [Pontiella agarivorans]
MGLLAGFIYKVAREDWEIEAVDALNYKTFVEEIPQHEANPERKLRDRFHEENTYIICVHEDQRVLAGMIAFRNKRPFSLDKKLENLDSYLPPDRSLCEIRLLAVEEEFRYTRISQGLIATLVQHAIDCGHDLAVISGTVRQIKLYKFLGFISFGPLVGIEKAQYQPMYLTLEAYKGLKTRSRSFAIDEPELATDDTMLFNFLPGPVDFGKQVVEVYKEKPSSHRGNDFVNDFQNSRKLLCELVGSRQVQILMGPGTLANDAVAGQLSLLCSTGLILVSGEFGHRLTKNANGAKLFFHTLEIPEGESFSRKMIEQQFKQHPEIDWVWATHCETSTGVLHDIEMLQSVCEAHEAKLCLDCISSLGTVPVDLSGVYLASGTSGKGLASISGLCMVFHNHDLQPEPDDLPCVLDLGIYQKQAGIPFTIQSNLVYALLAALQSHDWKKRFADVRDWSASIRRKLAEIDAPILAPDSCAMPAVVTIALPEMHSSERIGDKLKEHGVLISYRSDYLLERNWIQACMMGAEHKPAEKFIRLLRKELGA